MSLSGIAFVHPNGLLQLTNTSHQLLGRAFYSSPLQFKQIDPSVSSQKPPPFSFSTSFVIAIVPAYPDLSGHGLAFLFSPTLDFSTAIGSQYFGIFNSSNGNSTNHVVAIELDTLLNPELGDINNNHVGIDVNSLRSTESAPAAYYSKEDGENKTFSLLSGEPIQVWVDYDGVVKQLNVTLSPLREYSTKPSRPLLSSFVDLSSLFMDFMYVGFSAATGGVTGSHYILGWSFQMNGVAQQLDPSQLPSLPQEVRARHTRALAVGLSLAAVIIAVISFSVTIYVTRRKKYAELREDWEEAYGPHRFSYKDLFIATNGFNENKILGVGGFGKVYKGVLPKSKLQVAVKRISHDSRQGMKEFIAEVVSIGRLRHRNLVQLLGYCRRKGELLLVYDFMPNGSLDKFIFDRNKPSLNWNQRFRILRGVASGLLYLHEEWEQVVLHRDVKASNILLDAVMNARLGDFGLSRLYDHGTNPQTSHVVGTLGYLAHELTRTGKATTSCDVFSFGVVLLEVACGRRPINTWAALQEEANLVDWVSDLWRRGMILEARDPRLGEEYERKELELVLQLGLICTQSQPAARPNMRQVMQYLDGDAVLPELSIDASTYSSFSEKSEKRMDSSGLYPTSSDKAETYSHPRTESILFSGR